MKNENLAFLSLMEKFDPSLGLWMSEGSGHTKPVSEVGLVHSGVTASCRLVGAAQCGWLSSLPVAQILSALRGLQCSADSHLFGCFRWYAEEDEPVDTNAAFFIGLNLIVFFLNFRGRLEAAAQRELDAMLADLRVWFKRAAGERCCYYPNKYLGDLVCAWLLGEIADDRAMLDDLVAIMDEAADYWLEEHWGWGEHLSDCYSVVMLNELSCLLLFARHLPPGLRSQYRKLFGELMSIEDAFVGGPRVPAIRTYAFCGYPGNTAFRDTVRLWRNDEEAVVKTIVAPMQSFCFGQIFHSADWHKLAGEPHQRNEHVLIPCFGGAAAQAWVTDSARIGTMSRYPIMPNTDNAAWGLSWQSMPVAFASGDSLGFLRWHTREGGINRYHPARDKHSAYLNNGLTSLVAPPISGRTDALQTGPDALILRRMPMLSRNWEVLADQLVFAGEAFSVLGEEKDYGLSRLLVQTGDTISTFFFLSLTPNMCPKISRLEEGFAWEAVCTAERLEVLEQTAWLWMICWGRDVPLFKNAMERYHGGRMPGGESWTAIWPRGDGDVAVQIEPVSDKEPPLGEIIEAT